MAIKIFSVLMGIFALALVFVSTQDFYFIDIKDYSLDFKSVQAKKLQAYVLDSNKTLSSYKADEWTRYADNKDVFTKVLIQEQEYNLSANEMNVKGQDTILKGDVLYKDINTTQITSQMLHFNNKTKILSTQNSFQASNSRSTIIGESLRYDMNHKKLEVQKVKAWLNKQ